MNYSTLGLLYDWLIHPLSPMWMHLLHDRHPMWADYIEKICVGMTLAAIIYSIHLLLQWYAHVTDVVFSYSWRFDGTGTKWSPSFDMRNRSASKQYNLDSIVYRKKGQVFWIDNSSIFDKELKPERRYYIKGEDVAPLKNIELAHPILPGGKFDLPAAMKAMGVDLTIRDQAGREWRAVGPGQEKRGRLVTFLLNIHWIVKIFRLE